MQNPRINISVILPTFNRCDILSRTLDLYARQQNLNRSFEVIVVDDGSTDRTMEMLQAKQQSSEVPLQVSALPRNSGPSAARNKAMSMAKGDILLFSGDDILPTPEFLAEHYNWHTELYPEPHVAVLGHVRWAAELGVTPFMAWLEQSGTQFAYGKMTHGQLVSPGLVHSSNVSVKAAFLRSSKENFDERLRFHEDSEWATRLERHGLQVRYNSKAIGDHLHPTDMESSLARMKAVGRSLVALKSQNPNLYEQLTQGLAGENPSAAKKMLLLLINPVLGRRLYAPLSRAIQKHLVVDKLFAACHASYMLSGLREELSRSSGYSPEPGGSTT